MDDRAHSADLFLDKFHPISLGSLKGELLDNSAIGPAPALTWSLEFDWPEGHPSVDIMIDGIPLDVPSWRELEGAQVECTASDEPIAAYVCDGDHFEFEYVHIQCYVRSAQWRGLPSSWRTATSSSESSWPMARQSNSTGSGRRWMSTSRVFE